MAKEIKLGCGVPKNDKDVVIETKNIEEVKVEKEETNMIRVGRPAPLFTTQAFHDGKFTEVNLEDYKGKWTVLCFYPGDFTFV